MANGRVKAKLGKVANGIARKAKAQDTTGPSPNPATNLILADIALRGGGRLLRRAVERTLLGVRYSPNKASAIVKGRGITQTVVGTVAARVATGSIPGAIIIGGGILAKTLYDRSKNRAEAIAEGEAKLDEQAENARKA